jgi:hypothetical protein
MQENGIKYLTAERVIALLSTLDPNTEVIPNSVQNLTLIFGGEFIGYLDFMHNGEIHLIDEEDEAKQESGDSV